MLASCRSLFLPFLLVCLLPWTGLAQGQESPSTDNPQSRVTLAQLEQLHEDLQSGREQVISLAAGLDTTAAVDWLAESPLDRLKERAASSLLEEAVRAIWQEAVSYEQAGVEQVNSALNRAQLAREGGEGLAATIEQVEAMLNAPPPSAAAEDERTVSHIEQDISGLNARRSQVALELSQNRQTLVRLEDQLRNQGETLNQLQRESGEGDEDAAVQPGAEDSAVVEARSAVREAQRRRTDAMVIAIQLDSQSLPPRIQRLRLDIRAHELHQLWLAERLAALQEELAQRSTQELRALSGAVQDLVEREPRLREEQEDRIAALRNHIDQIAEAQGKIQVLQTRRNRYLNNENDLKQTLANVQERLEVSGLNETLGSLFLEEQRRLREMGDQQFNLQEIERELSQSQLRNITLREQLAAITSPVAVSNEDPALAQLRHLEQQALTTRLQAEESLTVQLRQIAAQVRSLVSLVEELEQILRETLIWWPSHKPVGPEWLRNVPAALQALLQPESWQEFHSATRAVTIASPITSLFTLLVVWLLYRMGQGTLRHLDRYALKTKHRYTDNIKLTFKGMGWSLLRALPVPVLLISLGYRLGQIETSSPGVEALAAVLFSIAFWWLASHLSLLFTRSNGIGPAHFKWHPSVIRRLRHSLAWYLPTQLILLVTLSLAFAHPDEVVFDVMGRLGLLAVVVAAGVLAWRLLEIYPDIHPTAPTERRRRLIRPLAVAYAAVLAFLTLAGYLLTVSELMRATFNTVMMLGLVWLGYRLAVRALILSETRLRIRRMQEERAEAAALESNSPMREAVLEVQEPDLSMEDINHQTRSLVKVTAGAALVLSMFWVWSDILPALTWLDGVKLWSRTITIGGTEVLSDVSLQDFLLAGFLAVVLVMAAGNLPGLVEILLARTTRMDASGRFTVTTLLRYSFIVVTIISVFSLLGLRWAELQWLVAALTLGLGFGLQEVVANFVCGLIMLFERPVRVGDTITIGEYSGTVGKIRTRATTVIDWDNREIVVPNKAFITERLINWTLSDTMTRLVLPVRVSYQADIDLVLRTLEEIARSHPMVLSEPPPEVLFLNIGDSALSFELRVFVNQLRDRLATTSALHRTIIQQFRALGIEIAYPQMGVNIHERPEHERPKNNGLPQDSSATLRLKQS